MPGSADLPHRARTGSGEPSARAPRSVVEVIIHGLAGGGDGVAHLPAGPQGGSDGVVFVPDTAPGDRARVEIEGGRRGWRRGRLLEVLSPGPGRREPRCGLSLLCGGCQWHHLTGEVQRRAKQEILGRAFRQARLLLEPPALVPAPRSLGYRSRARLRWEPRPDSGVRLGFRARRSHRLVEAQRCPVLAPRLELLLSLLGRLLPSGSAGEALLLCSPAGLSGAALRGEGLPPGAAARLGEALDGAVTLVEILDARGRTLDRWGPPALDLAASGEEPFWGAPHRFSQANLEVNQALRARVRAWATEALEEERAGPGESGVPLLVELYAGSGNLTRELATLGPMVAVEGDPGAVELGRRNLAGRAVTWRVGDAPAALAALAGSSPRLVVLDPPRTGARELLGPLVALAPPRILYLSCDAMTLARDISALASEGYAPIRMEALDTLPQTAHFEIVMDLRLQGRQAR